ncbi:MAG: hypothetical protein Q8L85_09280 [Alphaproteobacteria bacterium]|nr:hypothetical protein [Alphaproteobacteria bacterium]
MKKRLLLLSLFTYVTMAELYASNLTMNGSIAVGGKANYEKCKKHIGRIIKTANAYTAYLEAGAFEIAAEEVQKNKKHQQKLQKCEKKEKNKWYRIDGGTIGTDFIF